MKITKITVSYSELVSFGRDEFGNTRHSCEMTAEVESTDHARAVGRQMYERCKAHVREEINSVFRARGQPPKYPNSLISFRRMTGRKEETQNTPDTGPGDERFRRAFIGTPVEPPENPRPDLDEAGFPEIGPGDHPNLTDHPRPVLMSQEEYERFIEVIEPETPGDDEIIWTEDNNPYIDNDNVNRLA